MPTFAYVARTPQGQLSQGTIDAPDERTAIQQLRQQGLVVTSLRQQGGAARVAAAQPQRMSLGVAISRVKLRDMALFCRQLATLINAGVSLVRALAVLERQTQNPRLKFIIRQLTRNVEDGMALSRAMAQFPGTFSNLFIGMVRAGEVGGVLDETLQRMATFLEKDLELRRKVKSAMTYPTLVIIFALAIVIFLSVWIVPKFMQLFADLGVKEDKFPLPTLIMKRFSEFLINKWYFLVGGVVAFFVAFSIFIRTRFGKKVYDWLKLKVPILGPINHKIVLARFARTFGTLMGSGVPILQAMDTTAGAIDNEILSKAIMEARMAIREGERIADPLERSRLFPPMVVHMISVGEETGALDQMLEKVADFYESEVDAALHALASTIEPVMIVVLGVIVLFILLSVFLPLITIIQDLSQGEQ
ncbi:MAG: type II secretion system F family protein [Armatimonadetes bacterium]|nr:type II secretion system F family protein [Armatimonadota bacterium]MDW8028117.1 type II secretion system F family protein [Armatimonadota bacterium]